VQGRSNPAGDDRPRSWSDPSAGSDEEGGMRRRATALPRQRQEAPNPKDDVQGWWRGDLRKPPSGLAMGSGVRRGAEEQPENEGVAKVLVGGRFRSQKGEVVNAPAGSEEKKACDVARNGEQARLVGGMKFQPLQELRDIPNYSGRAGSGQKSL